MPISRDAKAHFCVFDILLKSMTFSGLLIGSMATASAANLSFEPVAPIVPQGTSVAVDVNIDGLDTSGPDSLGSFDLNITFDNTIVVPTSVIFGSGLGDTDPLAFEVVSSMAMPDGNTLNIAMTSFLADLTFQPAAFTLATINFSALAVGVSPLATAMEQLFDEFADPLALTSSSAGSITVTANAGIPIPGSLPLILGAIGLLAFRERRV